MKKKKGKARKQTVHGNGHSERLGMTCIHVLDGTATDIAPVISDRGRLRDADWLCCECAEKIFGDGPCESDVSDLRTICADCLAEAIKPYLEKRW